MECGDFVPSGDARSASFFGDILGGVPRAPGPGVPDPTSPPFLGDLDARAASRSISSAHSRSASAAATIARSPTSAAARHDAASPVAATAAASALRVSIAAPRRRRRAPPRGWRGPGLSSSSSIAFRSADPTDAARSNSSALLRDDDPFAQGLGGVPEAPRFCARRRRRRRRPGRRGRDYRRPARSLEAWRAATGSTRCATSTATCATSRAYARCEGRETTPRAPRRRSRPGSSCAPLARLRPAPPPPIARLPPRLLLQSLQLGARRLFLLPQPRRLVHPRVREPPTQRATPAKARADGDDERPSRHARSAATAPFPRHRANMRRARRWVRTRGPGEEGERARPAEARESQDAAVFHTVACDSHRRRQRFAATRAQRGGADPSPPTASAVSEARTSSSSERVAASSRSSAAARSDIWPALRRRTSRTPPLLFFALSLLDAIRVPARAPPRATPPAPSPPAARSPPGPSRRSACARRVRVRAPRVPSLAPRPRTAAGARR